MEKRDVWEEAIRSKLADYEAQPDPADWEALRNRLTQRRRLMPRRWIYAAAALVLLAVLFEGGRRWWRHEVPTPTVADVRSVPMSDLPQPTVPDPLEEPTAPAVTDLKTALAATTQAPSKMHTKVQRAVAYSEPVDEPAEIDEPKEPVRMMDEPSIDEPLLAELPTADEIETVIDPIETIEKQTAVAEAKPARRRWGFGMGGGGYTTGLQGGSGDINAVYARNEKRADLPPYEMGENLSSHPNREDRMDIKHARPLSFGLGVSYRLNDRWSLQSGVTYTCLTSRWHTMSAFEGHTRQRLHFVGVPVGVSYRIADWQRVRFYAAAGGAVEWNVAGSLRTVYYYGSERRHTEHTQRMKEWQWSAYARTGAAYPLLRFLSLYAEVGASYYFNNGSPIETIRSEKPFYVSMQTGLRIGF